MKLTLAEVHLQDDGGYVAIMGASDANVGAQFEVRLPKRRTRERWDKGKAPLAHHRKPLENIEQEARALIAYVCRTLS